MTHASIIVYLILLLLFVFDVQFVKTLLDTTLFILLAIDTNTPLYHGIFVFQLFLSPIFDNFSLLSHQWKIQVPQEVFDDFSAHWPPELRPFIKHLKEIISANGIASQCRFSLEDELMLGGEEGVVGADAGRFAE